MLNELRGRFAKYSDICTDSREVAMVHENGICPAIERFVVIKFTMAAF